MCTLRAPVAADLTEVERRIIEANNLDPLEEYALRKVFDLPISKGMEGEIKESDWAISRAYLGGMRKIKQVRL